MNTTAEFQILYEDANLIAADKPEGLASIAESDITIPSLHSLLEKKYSQKLLIVHRLDKEVSGVILFARNANTHRFLNSQFNNRQIKKFYTALVHGVIEKDGEIKKPIREFGSGRMGVDEKNGKPSATKYSVVKRFDKFTLLELNPSTGRRHQLRVHLYSIGHPIAGDLRYGDRTVQEKFPRLMLHAKSLEFKIPGGKSLLVESKNTGTFLKQIEQKGTEFEKNYTGI
jgi:tRNA pseudouridine32 synthase / 23S rRNA pseudouridine746 synthase